MRTPKEVINVTQDSMKKFKEIQKTRPQDKSQAETFEHILYVYGETKFRPKQAKEIMTEKLKLEQETKKS